MAIFKDVLNFKEIWRKLTTTAGITNPSDFPFDMFVTSAPLSPSNTLYVDINGNDSNAGVTADAPLKTLTAAFSKIPQILPSGMNVIINLGAGTFSETSLNISNVFINRGASLTITGTTGIYTPATGSGSGTVTSVTALTTQALAIINDTAQNLPVNALIGKYIKITSGGSAGTYRQIVSNTATGISVTSTTGLSTSVTYEIHDLLTIFSGNVASGSGATSFIFANIRNGDAISATFGPVFTLNQIAFQNTTGGTGTVFKLCNSDSVFFQNCSFNAPVAQTSGNPVFYADSVKALQLTGCYFTRTTSAQSMVRISYCGSVTLNSCYARGPASGGVYSTSLVVITGSDNFIPVNSLFEKTDASGNVLFLANVRGGQAQSAGVYVWNSFGGGASSSGVTMGDLLNSQGTGNAVMRFSFLNVKGVENGVVLYCPGTSILVSNGRMDNVTAIGFHIQRGAQASVAAYTFGTAPTNEVRLDTTNTNFAAVDAASPTVITNTYLSLISR